MPYTLTHPGFALPLRKSNPSLFSTSGLVFGSVAPDFDIILRFSNQRIHIFQYTLPEILLLILPIAICAAIYFHLIIKGVLIQYAPKSLQGVLAPYATPNKSIWTIPNGIRLISSALLAIFLHLGLDMISHCDAYYYKVNAIAYFQSFTAGEIAYYASMYIPPILFSAAGGYLLIRTIKDNSIELSDFADALTDVRTRKFLFVFLLLTISFAIIKLLITGIEYNFEIDSIVISMTNGFLISFFVTPTIFAAVNYLNKLHE